MKKLSTLLGAALLTVLMCGPTFGDEYIRLLSVGAMSKGEDFEVVVRDCRNDGFLNTKKWSRFSTSTFKYKFIGWENLVADMSEQGLASVFELVPQGGNNVALKDVSSGRYIRAGLGPETYLGAASSSVRGWETFNITYLPNDGIALKSVQNNKYVRAGVTKRSYLAAVSPHRRGWETFRLIRVGNNRIKLQSKQSGKYVISYKKVAFLAVYPIRNYRDCPDLWVRAGLSQEAFLGASSPHVREWESFYEIPLSGDMVAFKSFQNNKYVRAGVTQWGKLAAASPRIGFWEKFKIQPLRLTSLSGDTSCVWGAANCNRCVRNVSAELDRLQNNYQSAGRIRFDGYAYPTSRYILHRISSGSYEHVQSIGRIAGVGNNEYMVFTHSTDSDQSRKKGALAVVRMGARQNTGGGPFYGMPRGDGSNQNTSNRTVARTYTGNNHPGGLSVLGHYVYVAQWCQPHGSNNWCNETSATVHGMGFSVYDVSKANLNSSINSNPPIHRHYRHAYGESWIGSSSTASVAAVKLSSGQYFVALGKSGGRKYGFYTATSPTGPFTFHNSSSIGYYGENANIVTECSTGDLYMFQIEGYGSSDNVDKVHLYKLVLNNGVIGFQYVKSRTFYCRGSRVDGANDWCHFDAGAGMYVTPAGNLILYATDWQQSSYGNIRLVEFY